MKYVFEIPPTISVDRTTCLALNGGMCSEPNLICLFGYGNSLNDIEDVAWSSIINHEHHHDILHKLGVESQLHHKIIAVFEELFPIKVSVKTYREPFFKRVWRIPKDLICGTKDRFPFCCIVHYCLDQILGRRSGMRRGSLENNFGITYVPCYLCKTRSSARKVKT